MASNTAPSTIDGVLVAWGERVFYPGNRRTRGNDTPRLTGPALRQQADAVRARIAGVLRRAPQVIVKVTGGGRGMRAIVAHLRYIGKNGRLPMEDDQGRVQDGKDAVRDIAEEWRWGGNPIPEQSGRREAFNVMLSMPRGSASAEIVQRAARAFALREFADHAWVMVLHDHQANPHVHLSVRAESRQGGRLNPRKADLQRWREVFAERLRGWGVDAEATSQRVRGTRQRWPALWQVKAARTGRLHIQPKDSARGERPELAGAESAMAVWRELSELLAASSQPGDRALAARIEAHQRTLLRDGSAKGVGRGRPSPPDRHRTR